MYRIALSALFGVICYRWGNLRNWKEYYPTILFYIIGDLSYNLLFHEKMLWQFQNLVSHMFSDYFIAFFVSPFAIILFLTHFPAGFWKRIMYMLAWALVITLLESFSYALGLITYDNGWSIALSFVFDYFMGLMIWIHYKKPLLAWPLSLGVALIMLYVFKVPLDGI